jgi:tetratricopeptide (TPR) repeat protein
VLERDRHRAALAEALDSITRRRSGRVVLLYGEAGAGKTTVARRFAEENRDRARILWGACDPLFTPRPLGPLLDAAELAGGELARVAADDAGAEQILRALVKELASRPPAVLVVEDLHWADEATLDVVRLLARRMSALPLLLMLTYRHDELPLAHPLRVVLGAMASDASIVRLLVEPLSPAAVALLAQPAGVDPEELFRKTSGNPFFVTEALAAGEQEIPNTVRDAVLARVSRLSPRARALLETAAVVPRPSELWLLRALCGDGVDGVGECTNAGMLRAERQAVSFRHELARLAMEESLPADRALELHRCALDALASPPSGTPDHARLAYHAEAAGDAGAVLAFAPSAAAHASALGAHREAAAQFARALAFAGPEVPAAYRAELLERRAYECNLAAQQDAAVAAATDAIAIYRSIGDRRAAGNTLRLLSVVLVGRGTISEVEPMAREAVSMLEGLPPGRELALAYATLAQVALNLDDTSSARRWGARAIELGEHLDEPEVLVYALVNIGTAELLDARLTGAQRIDRAIVLARGRLPPPDAAASIARAHVCAAWATTRTRSYAMADRYIRGGLEHCADGDLPMWQHYLLAYSSRSQLDQGRWSDATEMAATVVRDPAAERLARITALVVLGLVRARRGEADAQTPLHDAITLAVASGMPQAIGPARAAWSEMTWLRGDRSTISEAEAEAIRVRDPWLAGELWRWRSRNDATATRPKRVAAPYALELSGDWAAAADAWHALGCPYDEALALARHDDADAVRRALRQLRRLGAHDAARIVARRLRTRRAQLRQS